MNKYGIASMPGALGSQRQETSPAPVDTRARAPSPVRTGKQDGREEQPGADAPERADTVFSLTPIENPGALGKAWCALEELCAPSLFQSWGWIRTWLDILPAHVEPQVLTARRGSSVSGLAIFCRAQRRRHGWLSSSGLFLNETGVPDLDTLTVEYNGLLCRDDDSAQMTADAIAFLVDSTARWDELYLSGVDDGVIAAAESAGLDATVTARHPYHFVDLSDIRAREKSYLDCVSRNTRSQVRRAVRKYEDRGTVSIAPAATADQALAWFGEMKTLHQAYWQSRGQPGAFANPVFETFHRAFIAARFAAGEIEMLRVAVDGNPIGYLYNILHRGHVYSYQSGFAYEPDNGMKPGLVSHYLAIERNLSESAALYDFMAGGGQHKRSLGTVSREMVWLRAARPRLKFRAEAALRALKPKRSPASG